MRRARRGPRGRTVVWVATALVGSALVSSGPASADRTLVRPTPVLGQTVPGRGGPEAVMDRLGTTHVAWVEAEPGGTVALSRTRPPGGSWTPATRISPSGQDISSLVLGIDLAGRVTAAWIDHSAGTSRVWAALSADGVTWGSPAPLGTATEHALSLAVDHAGRAALVWRDESNGVPVARASTRAASGAWSPTETLGTASDIDGHDPAVAMDPVSGAATTVWSVQQGAESVAVVSSRWTPGGSWTPPDTVPQLNPAFVVTSPADVSVDGQGVATAAWSVASELFGGGGRIVVARAPAGGPWGAAEQVSDGGSGVQGARVAANGRGDVLVAWTQEVDFTRTSVHAVTRPAGAVWQEPREVTWLVRADGAVLDVAMDSARTAHVAWSGYVEAGFAFSADLRAWSTPVQPWILSGSTDVQPSIATPVGDEPGDVVVVRGQFPPGDPDGASGVEQVLPAALDSVGPRIDSLAVPPTATAGEATAISASALDAWSNIESYRWTFGDGASALGPSVVHTFPSPGTYPVTLTVIDAASNSTTRQAQVTVTAPVPVIRAFELSRSRIMGSGRPRPSATRLSVRLNTPATVRVVVTSRHRHRVDGKLRKVRVVLTRAMPAGLSRIVVRPRLRRTTLVPDRYVITGVARNESGRSPARTAKLKVVRPRDGR